MAKKKMKYRQILAGMSAIFPITITNANGKTKVNHDFVGISIKNKDEVQWQGSDDFIVTFPPGASPFLSDTFFGGPGRPAPSGPATKGKKGKNYKYTVQIAGAIPEDPIIHTDE